MDFNDSGADLDRIGADKVGKDGVTNIMELLKDIDITDIQGNKVNTAGTATIMST